MVRGGARREPEAPDFCLSSVETKTNGGVGVSDISAIPPATTRGGTCSSDMRTMDKNMTSYLPCVKIPRCALTLLQKYAYYVKCGVTFSQECDSHFCMIWLLDHSHLNTQLTHTVNTFLSLRNNKQKCYFFFNSFLQPVRITCKKIDAKISPHVMDFYVCRCLMAQYLHKHFPSYCRQPVTHG